MKTLEAISYHVSPHCATDNLLEASLDDGNLIFVSRQPLKSDVEVVILNVISRCYRDGHQLSPLSTIPNHCSDDFFKSLLQGLINRKMVNIVRAANEKRTRCEEYTAIAMTVNSLAIWHSYLGNHARWVLGVRHDKERGARKLKIYCCKHERCANLAQQGGVCVKHGAIVVNRKRCSQDGCDKQVVQGGVCVWGDSETLQPRRVRQSSPTRRSLCQAWGDSKVLQPRRVRQTSHTRRSLCPAWGESEALQPRRVRQSSRTRRSLCPAWGESSETQTLLNGVCTL